MEYKQECCRCGFCCVVEVCPLGIKLGVPATDHPCRLLAYEGGEAVCVAVDVCPTLAPIFGIGVGCCIDATAIKSGRAFDFAELPASTKRWAALQSLAKLIPVSRQTPAAGS